LVAIVVDVELLHGARVGWSWYVRWGLAC
jgi:hypothetical protein